MFLVSPSYSWVFFFSEGIHSCSPLQLGRIVDIYVLCESILGKIEMWRNYCKYFSMNTFMIIEPCEKFKFYSLSNSLLLELTRKSKPQTTYHSWEVENRQKHIKHRKTKFWMCRYDSVSEIVLVHGRRTRCHGLGKDRVLRCTGKTRAQGRLWRKPGCSLLGSRAIFTISSGIPLLVCPVTAADRLYWTQLSSSPLSLLSHQLTKVKTVG